MTLVEVMVVIAIIAVIAAVAYPVYTGSLQKARRADAKTALAELAQLEENFYVNGNVYTTSFSTLFGNATGKYGFTIQGNNLLSKEGYYLISFPDDKNTKLNRNFTLQAEPVASEAQAGDTNCKRFEINAIGQKEAWDADGNQSDDCW